MTVVEAVRQRLISQPAVAALVPPAAITALVWQQNRTGSAIRLQKISDIDDPHLRGSGVWRARIQVDVTATTKADAEALLAAVHGDFTGGVATGLHGFAGTVTKGADSLQIGASLAVSAVEYFDADDRQVPILSRDYMITYRIPSAASIAPPKPVIYTLRTVLTDADIRGAFSGTWGTGMIVLGPPNNGHGYLLHRVLLIARLAQIYTNIGVHAVINIWGTVLNSGDLSNDPSFSQYRQGVTMLLGYTGGTIAGALMPMQADSRGSNLGVQADVVRGPLMNYPMYLRLMNADASYNDQGALTGGDPANTLEAIIEYEILSMVAPAAAADVRIAAAAMT